jgi:hypothetical protein
VGIHTARAKGRQPIADLDCLHTLDAHHRPGQARVELAIPFDMTADAWEEPGGDHFHRAAERIAFRAAVLDLGDHPLARPRVGAIHR